MARARTTWVNIRAAIRRLLRETDETDPYWTNDLLLDLFNDNMDKRTMHLAMSTEGWVTDEIVTDVVADQREYSFPADSGSPRVLRVTIAKTTGDVTVETPLTRDERWGKQLVTNPAASTLSITRYPTYRLLGELIILEQPVGEDITEGLRIDVETMFPRLTGDSSKLTEKFPSVLETLLKYDTVIAALRHESAQSAAMAGAEIGENLIDERDEFLMMWNLYIEDRSEGRVFTEFVDYGD